MVGRAPARGCALLGKYTLAEDEPYQRQQFKAVALQLRETVSKLETLLLWPPCLADADCIFALWFFLLCFIFFA